jgi:hypothetical protein
MAKFTVGRKRRQGVNSPLYWFTLLGFTPCPRPEPEGYVPHIAAVYVICAGDAVKVGVSIDPGKRARGLQTGQDRIVRIFWATMLEYEEAYRLEAEVHQRLKRDTGGHASGEWYYLAPETAVSTIQSQIKTGQFWAEPDPVYGLFREGAVS